MKKKTEEEFQFLDGIDFKEAASADRPVLHAVKQAAGKKDALGVVMKSALELTGSEGETIDMAISSYEQMLSPIMEKIQELYNDPEAMKEVRRRIREGKTSWKKE